MRKRMLSLALALMMCLSLVPSAFAAEAQSAADKFTDVPSNAWYLDELEYAVYNGYISGTSAATFSPEANITRGQFVTILGRMLGAPTSSGETKFTDVPANEWYAPYVAWAAEKGYVNGTSATTFTPDANITVEQMATILANYISKSGVELKGCTSSEAYKDASSISGWATANMEVARQYGLLHTDASGNVSPRKNVSRAEGAFSLVLLARYTGLGVEPPVQQPVPGKEVYEEAERAAKEIHDELWAAGKITSSMTEKEKAIAYFEWMCINCDYHDSPEYTTRHFAYGALVDRVAVCDGLSYAYKLLLETEGIKCICIPDPAHNHMWNEVSLDGKWYKVNLSGPVTYSKDIDGSFDQWMFEVYRDKYFVSPISGPSIPVD